MCGRYVQSKAWREYQKYLHALRVLGGIEDRPSWNVAPSTTSLIVRQDADGLMVGRLRWGFLGPSGLMTNARSETAGEKSAFREAWRKQRALVPVDGWYEWRNEAGVKQPFYFTLASGEPLLLAALIKDSAFTLLTSETVGPLRTVHTRRPVAIPVDRAEAWCDSGVSWSSEELSATVVPESEFKLVPVSNAVNSTRNDGPNLIERGEVARPTANQMSLGI